LGGDHAQASLLRLLEDCAQIYQTNADFMLRRSKRYAKTCDVCAEVCQECARECERFTDQPMRQCAEVCRCCADSCREMTGGHRHATATTE